MAGAYPADVTESDIGPDAKGGEGCDNAAVVDANLENIERASRLGVALGIFRCSQCNSAVSIESKTEEVSGKTLYRCSCLRCGTREGLWLSSQAAAVKAFCR